MKCTLCSFFYLCDFGHVLNEKFLNSYHFAMQLIVPYAFSLIGGESHCRSSMWRDGPDDVSLWRSKQTSCDGLSGMLSLLVPQGICSFLEKKKVSKHFL